jgi:hypothetical protein
LEHVKITSQSGRGIVCVDGGELILQDCAIYDCAATGLYIGGPESRASLQRSDVVRNGLGMRRGIARGHSGIYLEQGFARVLDSNISYNTLTGVSAVSPDHAVLHLETCDLHANGTFQLELPPLGTPARRASVTNNNHLDDHASVQTMRSGLLELPLAELEQYANDDDEDDDDLSE